MNGINHAIIKFVFLFFYFATASPLYAEESVVFRPHTGFGYSKSSFSKYDGGISHAGGRLLLSASDIRKYGLEVTHFNLANGGNFTSIGIVLEQRLWDWFNMSIGTIGYFGYGENAENPVGVMANLGWEPRNSETLKPFITYRTDAIFHSKTTMINSLSVGLGWQF